MPALAALKRLLAEQDLQAQIDGDAVLFARHLTKVMLKKLLKEGREEALRNGHFQIERTDLLSVMRRHHDRLRAMSEGSGIPLNDH